MNRVKKTKYCLIGLAALSVSTFLSLSPTYAAYNGAILSEIEINPYHGNAYQIMIKTDKDIPIDKQVISDNEIILDLKNTKPAKFVNTIYNNATKVNHVIVQSLSNNRVKVTLQGVNMSASKVTLDTKGESLNLPEEPVAINLTGPDASTAENVNTAPIEDKKVAEEPKVTEEPVITEEVQNSQQEEIILQHPVNSFKPIDTSINEEMEEVEDNSSLGLMQGAMASGLIKKVFSTSSFDWLLRLAVLVMLIIGGLKLFKPKEKNVKIDLSNDLKTREIDLFKELNNRKGLIGSGLKDTSKINNISKKPGYNSLSNYGIKEYKNSQVPPLGSQITPTAKIKNEPKYNKANEDLLKALSSQKTLPKTPTSAFNTSKIAQKDINTAKVNIDSQKFLETMAKIYEKSGRTDLAQGIKHNILKSKIG
ncbi:MAG: hypothetical protein A2104_02495 [Candidatus Melainabacteria bacterium GWF2_32_7]|nr:MAG: hypothetical protein A2104_02495 [Candidatus Melainabacteria bacterium GWF2_32_7]